MKADVTTNAMPKYLQPHALVMVRFGAEWRQGAVLERGASDVTVLVRGERIYIHASVIWRDVREA